MKKVWEFCRPTLTVVLFNPYPGTAAEDTSPVDYSKLNSEFKKLFAYAETCNIKKLVRNPCYVAKKFIENINQPKAIWALIQKGFRAWA